jgi:predicted MFS family arabinose efflux permease
MPLRILENRSRTGAYLVMLCLATAMFGIFFFLTIFVQEVLGYSALKSGVAFLPLAVMIVLMSGVVSQIIGRIGARPLMIAGAAIAAVGMYWFSHLTVHSQYVSGLLGPLLVTSVGLGMLFVPLSLVALNKVRNEDSGVASSLLNTGQQVGGAIGLAALGTVTWTAVSNSVKHQVTQAAAAAGGRAGLHLPAPKAGATVPTPILHQALAVGISRGFLVAAGIVVLALVVVLVTIRVRREDLAGASAMPTVANVDDVDEVDEVLDLEESLA